MLIGAHPAVLCRHRGLQVKDLFPGADVVASDAMDDFVADVLPHKASLPLLTEEIGDTWIMGACVTGGKKGGKGGT